MSAEIMKENLLLLAGTFGALRKLASTTVSQQIYGKQDFFDRYRRDDVSPTVDKYYQMVDRFRERWPEGAQWPELKPIPKLGKNIDAPSEEQPEAERIG